MVPACSGVDPGRRRAALCLRWAPVRNSCPVHHGKWYTVLSNNPSGLVRQLQPAVPDPGAVPGLYPVPARTLVPLVPCCRCWRCSWVWFIATCDGEDWRPVDALSLLLLFGFSTLTFYTYSFPGYTDSLTYVLLTLAWFALGRNSGLRVLLLALLIFNHEQTIFSRPVPSLATGKLAGKRLAQTRGLVRTGTGSLFHLSRDRVPYFTGRVYGGYCLDPPTWPGRFEHVKDKWVYGLFQSFRLSWLVVIIGLLFALQRKNWNAVLFIFLPVALAASQYYFAYDLSLPGRSGIPGFFVAIDQLRKAHPTWFAPWQLL